MAGQFLNWKYFQMWRFILRIVHVSLKGKIKENIKNTKKYSKNTQKILKNMEELDIICRIFILSNFLEE
jgi:hypothetical protein